MKILKSGAQYYTIPCCFDTQAASALWLVWFYWSEMALKLVHSRALQVRTYLRVLSITRKRTTRKHFITPLVLFSLWKVFEGCSNQQQNSFWQTSLYRNRILPYTLQYKFHYIGNVKNQTNTMVHLRETL